MKKIYQWGIVAVVAGLVGIATAHTGTPALTVFSNGQTLTASALNANFAHIHNTLSGGISNANIAPNAAISGTKLGNNITNANIAPTAAIETSKLAGSSFVPKAIGFVGAPDSTGTTGLPCANSGAVHVCDGTTSGATVWTRTATESGLYEIRLGFTPKNTGNNLVVHITPADLLHNCNAVHQVSPDPSKIIVSCYNTDSSSVASDARFHFAVWEI